MFRAMEEDPFFTEPFRAHHAHLRQMMSNVPTFMGQDFLPSAKNSEQGPSCQRATGNEGSPWTEPFNKMSTVMEQIRNEMLDTQNRNVSRHGDPTGQSMNSSTVMTYAKMGNEPPKIFQASSHIHSVPGGMKEIRRTVRDSESGVEKMSIGHHIQDRAHVIQKSRNQKTGDEEIDQELINLNEAEAVDFDEEWKNNLSKFMPPGKHPYGIQDVKNIFDGQRNTCKRSTAPPPLPQPGGCGCPAVSPPHRSSHGHHVMKPGMR
ncbi:myeloid leukemia factor 1 [Scyliorhinus torazame]|uniref:myeloid leukemia factor 1 n=1 Tax=Scyliorhinus torazame TaxID=75743 RepID=UPI003B5A9B14